jgi:TolA-binding protein
MTRSVSVDRWWNVACRLKAAVVCLGFLIFSGCAENLAAPRADDAFLRGRGLVTTGEYAEAIPVLEGYLNANPRGQYAGRAGLFLGKAHVALGQFDEAKKAFEDTVKNSPKTLEGHKCRYKLAFVSLLTGDIDDATAKFDDLATHPDGPLAPEAKALARFLRTKLADVEGPRAEAD